MKHSWFERLLGRVSPTMLTEWHHWCMGTDWWNTEIRHGHAPGKPTRITPWRFLMEHTYYRATYGVLTLVCRWRGHAMEDDSYGGRESGAMAGHCTRCGWSFHHTLY